MFVSRTRARGAAEGDGESRRPDDTRDDADETRDRETAERPQAGDGCLLPPEAAARTETAAGGMAP